MKRLIKLLLILPLLFIVSISAKEIDMNGEPFADDKFYESGDIYKNVHIINDEYAFFDSFNEKLFYRVSLVSGTDSSPNNKVGFGRAYNTFFPESFGGSESIFGLEYNVPTPFLIPYYHEDAVLWAYRDYDVEYNDYEEQRIPKDMFYYTMNKPYYTVECGKSVKYGESTSCDLYLNFEQYGRENFANDLLILLVDSNFTFKVSSNDYELYNVRVNEDTKFTYNNGIVSGQLFDFIKVKQYINDDILFDQNIYNIIKEFKKYGELTNSCTGEIDLDGHTRSSLGGATTGSASTCVSKNKYKIKVLTLDITPLNNETKDGIITLSDMDMNIAEYDEEGNVKRVSGKLEEIDDTIVPMISIENVKGVEENPKTGLFNYLLLIIPIALLGIGFSLLRKINVFKKI